MLDAELSEQMQGWAGLENILTHLYLEIDHSRLHQILSGELDQLERYAVALHRALRERG